MKKHKEPTWTSLVVAALRQRDDFMSYTMLRAVTGASFNQVSAACFLLRKRRVIDCIVEPDGMAWWYALPPESDTRLHAVLERALETKPRRKRVSYVVANGKRLERCHDGFSGRLRCLLPHHHEGPHQFITTRENLNHGQRQEGEVSRFDRCLRGSAL